MPRISVVLPVYNGEAFVGDSIRSILNQTFQDFELIVVDDGSTDSTQSVIKAFEDSRLRYHRLEKNAGTVIAVAAGYGMASGEFVANMDADDISMPDRFRLQREFLAQHPEITVVGAAMELFGEESGVAGVPARDPQIKASLLPGMGNIYNPTAMVRKSFLHENGIAYEPALKGAFDWGFWVEIMRQGGHFANIEQPLVKYRVHMSQQSRGQSEMRSELARIRCRVLDLFYPELSSAEQVLIEPLLQWANPPAIPRENLRSGLEVLETALPYRKQSKAKEDRELLHRFLIACRNRWSAALDQSRPAMKTP